MDQNMLSIINTFWYHEIFQRGYQNPSLLFDLSFLLFGGEKKKTYHKSAVCVPLSLKHNYI